MWALAFIPHWAYYLSLIFGVGASLTNSPIIRIIGTLLIAGSCWYIGKFSNDQAWQARVAEMEAKVAASEAKATDANREIVTQVITKTKLVKQKTEANVQYITKYVAQDLDNQCTLTNAAVMLNNSASQNEVPGSSSGVVTGASDVKASEFLQTVTENYGTYYQLVEQVKGWQSWYYKQKKIFEE
jgi:hypothetical protein